MATAAQIQANRENAQKSSGPTSEAGKQASSMNNFRHGLTGHIFFLLKWENPAIFDALKEALRNEYQPQTTTEQLLVERMAQHQWLSQRAQMLQSEQMAGDSFRAGVLPVLNNLARYEATHARLFKSALHDLLKLRAERRKEQIGFESQKRLEANETRKAETHKLKTAIVETRLERGRKRNPEPEQHLQRTNLSNRVSEPGGHQAKTQSIDA